jgi:ankyrin repeat protein
MPPPAAVWSALCLVCLAVAGPAGAASDARLLDVVKSGNPEAVRETLKAGGVNVREPDGTTALHWAVRQDDLALVRVLIRAGADVNAANRYEVTPLSLAAINGNAAIVETLLAAGADARASSRDGQTVLMTAARTGNPAVVTALLDHGADPNAYERWLGETALMWAAAENHAAAVQALIDYGADSNAHSALSTIPTLQAAGIGLITMEFPKGGWTPLMYAAREGAADAVRTLADAGANLNCAGPDGITPLLLAIINGHYEVAVTLLKVGADVNQADLSGMTALYAAVDMRTQVWMQGRPTTRASGKLDVTDVVTALLDHGADVNARLKTPLLQRNHTAGDAGLGEGATPLMRAAKSGDVDLMRMLLAHGAEPSLVLKNHSTALMLAAGLTWRDGGGAFPTRDRGTEAGAIEAITLLMKAGVKLDAVNDAGDTAVHSGAPTRSFASSLARARP